MENPMDLVFAKHLAEAEDELAVAEQAIEDGQVQLAEVQEQIRAAKADADAARTRLAVMRDLITNVRRDLIAAGAVRTGTAPAASATTLAPAAPSAPTAPHVNGGRSMGPVLDEIMSDGAKRTVDEIVAIMHSRGYTWSRASVVNRCAERAKTGVFDRLGRSTYKLAAKEGAELPSGSANPEGGRGPQPEDDSQLGAGSVKEAGSLAI